jgi:hypothetical protein
VKVQFFQGPPLLNNFMEQYKKPVDKFFYSEKEWDRLGCGPLPDERDRAKQHLDACAKGNPKVDGKAVKGYN